MKAINRMLAAAVLTAAVGLPDAAVACPMCRQAAQADANLPRAFQASILFMLAMPALVLTGFGVGFYRLSKQMPQDVTDDTPDGA